MAYKHSELTDAIINAFYAVYNELGYGFLARVYERALAHELNKRGFTIIQQAPVQVYYDGQVVGNYYADLLIDNLVIVEVRVSPTIAPEHEAQILNYLRATQYEVGLILNFGPQPQIKRKIYNRPQGSGSGTQEPEAGKY